MVDNGAYSLLSFLMYGKSIGTTILIILACIAGNNAVVSSNSICVCPTPVEVQCTRSVTSAPNSLNCKCDFLFTDNML